MSALGQIRWPTFTPFLALIAPLFDLFTPFFDLVASYPQDLFSRLAIFSTLLLIQ
jgi:hypothetical protein